MNLRINDSLAFERLTSTSSLTTAFRAPFTAGDFQLVVSSGVDTVRHSFVVKPFVARDGDDAPGLLAAWAESRGGRAMSRDQLDSLPQVMRALIHSTDQMTAWHPMRSPWWIVPFALALAAEWWMRRRRGLA